MLKERVKIDDGVVRCIARQKVIERGLAGIASVDWAKYSCKPRIEGLGGIEFMLNHPGSERILAAACQSPLLDPLRLQCGNPSEDYSQNTKGLNYSLSQSESHSKKQTNRKTE